MGLSCDSGLGHAALGLRLSLRLAPTNAHPPRRRHRCLRSRGHRVVGLRLLLRGGVLRRRRARGYRAVLVPLLHRRRLAVLLLLLGLRVLLLVLRRRLRVLRLRLLVLLLRRRLLLVLPVLLLRRRLLVLMMLLVLLLRRRLLRRRGGRPSRFVHVLPLLGVVVLLFFRKGFYTWQGKDEGKSVLGLGVFSWLFSSRIGWWVVHDGTRERTPFSRVRSRPYPGDTVRGPTPSDRIFAALLFFRDRDRKRDQRTDTVGGCVITFPSNGRWGGNWMNPEPTTRWGFFWVREGLGRREGVQVSHR